MLKLINVVTDGVAIYNKVRKEVLIKSFGDKADEVQTVNNAIGIVSCIQLINDIKKMEYKKAAINQVMIYAVNIKYNLYMHKKYKESISNTMTSELDVEDVTLDVEDVFSITPNSVIETKTQFIKRARKEHLDYVDMVILKYPMVDDQAMKIHVAYLTSSNKTLSDAIASYPAYL